MESIVKDRFLPKEEFSMLVFNMLDGMSTHSLSMWVKSKTEEEFVVVPREFCVMTIEFFELMAFKNAHKVPEVLQETLREFETIRKYL